jgi:hypothetical protein
LLKKILYKGRAKPVREIKNFQTPIVSIQGGLGNQLWQWYFGHSLLPSNKFRIDRIYRDSVVGSRNFELEALMSNCSHIVHNSKNNLVYKFEIFIFRALDRLFQFKKLRKFVESLGYFRDDPRVDQEQTSLPTKRIRYAKGYFQKYIESASQSKVIREEIVPITLELIVNLRKKYKLEMDYNVIHIRRSDYSTNDFSPVNIGTLDDSFFVSWALQRGVTPLVILTEDSDEIHEIKKLLDPYLILDKDDTSAWETLALMSAAKEFLGSNSSLSWWGARLCSYNAGVVWLPEKWSYWDNINSKDYLFPECNLIRSSWLQRSLFEASPVD